ncbi:T9SS type A sorting domain-containing protein [uncultured Bacteroides sp.]|uniref:right-handed parallel beta-helix repeat-containing protein n=1 Tax=uncultured Bacteroides sp. TaxID=162156 RepID=UPI002AAC3752|nr:T9SS type A sorting domain-containing protein [uncultured Bacteroides sp.]
MKKWLLLLSVFSLFAFAIHAKNYYVATNGNDITGTGSINDPYASIIKAQQYVVPGDTVFVRGGTYVMTESQISQKFTLGPYACMHCLDKSGTSASKRICYWAYRGEHPVFDMSMVKPAGYRNTVFYTTGSWLHIKGLEVIGTQVTISTHTQSECFRNEGSNNIFEQLKMHDGMAIGFYLTKGANNLILNCDAYRNWDYYSENGRGGNTDGFGCHPAKGGSGNIFRGCRSWFNSDDGYDCINAYESVIFENSWSFYNGYNTSFVSEGDGNGFKAGGYGQAPVVAKLPSPIPAHTVRFCMSYRNKANGFYSNHHVVTGSSFYNNTAFRNATNFNMLSQQITKSAITGNDTTLDCQGINHVLHNNISFRYSAYAETANLGTSVDTYNSFSPNSGVTVDASDFVSTDESLLVADRQADGSLPDIGFLKLKEGSNLIDKGMNLGFPFSGTAPDLGAFEYQSASATGISGVNLNKTNWFYPNPVKQSIYFGDNHFNHVTIYNLNGRKIIDSNYVPSINVSFLDKGYYLLLIKGEKGEISLGKMIKD